MAVLGVDLGGTKLSIAAFETSGKIISKKNLFLNNRQGREVGQLITEEISLFLKKKDISIKAIGISVPGISKVATGTVWAPNIPGWDDYPLQKEIEDLTRDVQVRIASDRACYILGESWRGNAAGCKDAIFLSVGTGIGAGILIDGKVLKGTHDIAGAIGWMALDPPYHSRFTSSGCFEYYASGEGISRYAKELLSEMPEYNGLLSLSSFHLSAADIIKAYEQGDEVAVKVLNKCIELWGMASANLISLFNPEKIIFGGGVFGPASKYLEDIKNEAKKWSQPISFTQVKFEPSALDGDAGLYGAGYIAIQSIFNPYKTVAV
jgi:glucokinase